MCRIKARVCRGAIAAERVAYIKTVSGVIAEVVVAASQVSRDTIEVSEVTRDRDRVLIELPRESASGDWRLWVTRKQIL